VNLGEVIQDITVTTMGRFCWKKTPSG